MKVQICAGTQCMFYGADEIMERISELKQSLSDYPSVPEGAVLDVELIRCDRTCKNGAQYISPVVYVDGERLEHASSPQVMEKILDGLQEGK